MAAIPERLSAALSEFSNRLAAICPQRVLELRLFGSTARGDARGDSDLDVLVLVDELDFAVKDSITALAWDVTCEHGLLGPLSPLVMSAAHYHEMLARERRLALDIEAEGIRL